MSYLSSKPKKPHASNPNGRSDFYRFTDKINFNGATMPHMNTNCWEWTSAITPDGYGLFSLNQTNEYAHRISYLEWVGEIPDGLQINHHCDNPKCVRPDHIYAGTSKDNTHDMIRRGRYVGAIG